MALCEQSLPYVRAISPYQPGKPITQLAREMGIAVDQIVKLASNENPLGMSPKARAAAEQAMADLSRYPDDFLLKQALVVGEVEIHGVCLPTLVEKNQGPAGP